ncbi:MAG TPA: hypothetical protein VEW25_06935 [Allosphingosinicella sp.]|nr:hypothetical protein [Allosphingosinicella sp.]
MSRPRPFHRSAVLAAAALLAASGCTPNSEFPSLAPRAIEQEDPLAEPVRTAPVVAGEPELRARAAELLDEARRGDRAFEAALGSAASAARGAGAPGSESWVVAQQQVSRAEAARAPTTSALAELDRLATERARLATNEGDFASIQGALEEVGRIAAGQQQRLDRLRDQLRR